MTFAILDTSGALIDFADSAEEAIDRAADNDSWRAVESDRFGYWRSLESKSLYPADNPLGIWSRSSGYGRYAH